MRNGTRMRVGIIVETGEPREVAPPGLLIGFGAGAVNPYLAFESIAELARERRCPSRRRRGGRARSTSRRSRRACSR